MPFYKTIVTVTVLSEEPLASDLSLGDLAYFIDEGDGIGQTEMGEPEELTGKQVADALHAIGSEPGFFQLDDEGVPLT